MSEKTEGNRHQFSLRRLLAAAGVFGTSLGLLIAWGTALGTLFARQSVAQMAVFLVASASLGALVVFWKSPHTKAAVILLGWADVGLTCGFTLSIHGGRRIADATFGGGQLACGEAESYVWFALLLMGATFGCAAAAGIRVWDSQHGRETTVPWRVWLGILILLLVIELTVPMPMAARE